MPALRTYLLLLVLRSSREISKWKTFFPISSITICKNIHQKRAYCYYNVCSTSLFMEANELSYYLPIRVQLPQKKTICGTECEKNILSLCNWNGHLGYLGRDIFISNSPSSGQMQPWRKKNIRKLSKAVWISPLLEILFLNLYFRLLGKVFVFLN